MNQNTQSTTVRTFSGKQLAELKKLFTNHEITHLGIIDEDGCVLVEYQEIAWKGRFNGDEVPVITLKTMAINR
jgi:hypothetical protein